MAAIADAEAAAAAQEIKNFALTALRTRYPFLKADALENLLKDMENCALDHLQKQQQAITESKANFDFFSIPPELRNRIYEDILVLSEDPNNLYEPASEISVQKSYRDRPWRKWVYPGRRFSWPALLQVNKQIRNEALPIYLGQNTFVVHLNIPNTPSAPLKHPITSWLAMLGLERAKLAKNLVLRFRYDDLDDIEGFAHMYFGHSVIVTPGKVRKMLGLKGCGVKRSAFRVQYGNEVLAPEEGAIQELTKNGKTVVLRERED